MKCTLYQLFVKRWRDVDWTEHDLVTWKKFVLRGVKKIPCPTSFKEFRWLGMLDHLYRLFSATNYVSVARTINKPARASSYGYKRGTSVDDIFGMLFEAATYAKRWADSSLVLTGQDILTAFDTVKHFDVIETYRREGASAHQLLSMARDMHNVNVTLDIPNVATTEEIPMTKALKTGVKAEPNIFVYMFESVLDYLEAEWSTLGLGYSGSRVPTLLTICSSLRTQWSSLNS